jgi:hypothetical protein
MTLLADYRGVPLEVLRDFAHSRAAMTSIRAIADEAGIGRSTMHKFMLGRTDPQPRVRRLLALWYLRTLAEAEIIDVVRPYLSAMGVLLSGIPQHERDGATADLAGALSTIYDARASLPQWLQMLLRGIN